MNSFKNLWLSTLEKAYKFLHFVNIPKYLYHCMLNTVNTIFFCFYIAMSNKKWELSSHNAWLRLFSLQLVCLTCSSSVLVIGVVLTSRCSSSCFSPFFFLFSFYPLIYPLLIRRSYPSLISPPTHHTQCRTTKILLNRMPLLVRAVPAMHLIIIIKKKLIMKQWFLSVVHCQIK